MTLNHWMMRVSDAHEYGHLFGYPTPKKAELLPFQVHSITSENAAISMAPKAKGIRAKVLALIVERPRTDEELIEALAGNPSTIRPRRVELYADGLIEPVGTRPTHSGRQAVIWGPANTEAV